VLPGARIISDLLGLHGADNAPERPASRRPFDPNAVTHPVLKALMDFWTLKRDERGALPGRADICPTAIKPLLPHIALADVEDGGNNFRFRLFGTRIVEDSGIDLTGRTWRDEPGHDKAIERSRILVESHEPYYLTGVSAKWSPRTYKCYSTLALPLAKDGVNVDMVLYGVVFTAP